MPGVITVEVWNRFPFSVSDNVQRANDGAFTRLYSTGCHTVAVDVAKEIAIRDNATRYVWDCTMRTVVRLFATVSADGTVTYH